MIDKNPPVHANCFSTKLEQAIRAKKTPALVGLDPRLADLPEVVRGDAQIADLQACAAAFATFCCQIIDVVAPLVPAVKPQAAFFEQLGPAGMQALAEVILHARARGLLVILDGKRNDIGSTAEAYADAYLGERSAWKADALTISPYLGEDSLTPFFQVAGSRGAGLFVLVKTSNPGGGMLQDLATGATTRTVYEHVAALVESHAKKDNTDSGYGYVGAVTGATYPQQLAQLRAMMPHAWLLIPGYGSQGGTAADTAGGFDKHGLGAIVNSSRAINFAHKNKAYAHFAPRDWQKAVEAATRDMIDDLAAHTPAGRLSNGSACF